MTTATIMPGAKPLTVKGAISQVKVAVDAGLVEVHLRALPNQFITLFLEAPDADGKHTFRHDISNEALLTTDQWKKLTFLLRSAEWKSYVDELLAFHFVKPAPGTTKSWNLG